MLPFFFFRFSLKNASNMIPKIHEKQHKTCHFAWLPKTIRRKWRHDHVIGKIKVLFERKQRKNIVGLYVNIISTEDVEDVSHVWRTSFGRCLGYIKYRFLLVQKQNNLSTIICLNSQNIHVGLVLAGESLHKILN